MTMSAKPILFSTPMVQALLDGRKTQTRRIIKPQPTWDGRWFSWNGHRPNTKYGACAGTGLDTKKLMCDSSPYGKRGDYLWVRETFQTLEAKIIYGASPPKPYVYKDIRWKPSIHMPRRASRLTLKITNVRVERLQDISEDDAQAEGIPPAEIGKCRYVPTSGERTRAAVRFHDLWDSINASRGHGWDKNPWVWVICFEVIRKNIDEIAER